MDYRCLGHVILSLCLALQICGAAVIKDPQDGQQAEMLTLLSRSNHAFSQSLYQKIAANRDTLVYSPYSIHSSLTMASNGARGDTLTEMRNVLELSALGDHVSTTYRDLMYQLNSAKNAKLRIANGVFLNPSYNVEIPFLVNSNDNYLAQVARFDLKAQGGPERAINDFVAQRTENMITDLLPRDTINGETIMVLVNTIFFNGTWKDTFDPFYTSKEDFHQLGGATQKIDMMYTSKLYTSYKRDSSRSADVLELPFKGDRFRFSIVLPHQKDGITAVEKTLSKGVDDLFEGLSKIGLQVSIPKFKVMTKLDLPSTLQSMGMKKAFNEFAADFKGIFTEGNCFLDKVIHQAVIEVTEEGTVAAASTAVVVSERSNNPDTHFYADHPFLIFLWDSQTRQILFQGKFSG